MAKKIFLFILIVVVLIAAGYFAKRTFVERAAEQAALQERKQWEEKTEELEEKVALLEGELQEQAGVDEGKLEQAFGETSGGSDNESAEPGTTGDRVVNFFLYLDQKGYLSDYGINENFHEYFIKLLDRLKQTSPVVSGETANLYALMKNITYFYRVLGKENLQVLKTVLANESEIIEPTMELFFEWLNPWKNLEESEKVIIPAEVMYEYASFFTQTIAGQTYLFRRDSKLRSLTQYYCIVILDMANRYDLNRHGIDIMPYIDSLENDIKNHKYLAKKIDYLRRLGEIKRRYN